jgi:hypothetical protein
VCVRTSSNTVEAKTDKFSEVRMPAEYASH